MQNFYFKVDLHAACIFCLLFAVQDRRPFPRGVGRDDDTCRNIYSPRPQGAQIPGYRFQSLPEARGIEGTGYESLT